MSRHGNTRRTSRRKNLGHRMHRKTALQRILTRRPGGIKLTAWGRGAV